MLSCGSSSSGAASAIGAKEAVQVDRLELLESYWAVAERGARLQMKAELEKFIADYSESELTDRARVLLAWILVEQRKLESARKELNRLTVTQGRLFDEKELLLGKIARREGDAAESLKHLLPLRGKLFTDEAQRVHSAELVQSAIAARRYRLAIDAMVTRAQQALKNNRKLSDEIVQDIRSLPVHILLRIAEEFYSTEPGNEVNEVDVARGELLEVIVNYLAKQAVKQKDSRLARDLLESAPTWLRAGPYGDELSNLSLLAREEARINGRTIGVVLGGVDPEDNKTQARSIQVALGLSRAIKQAPEAQVELVFAENRGSLRAALGVLTGMGASILVSGVNPQQSAQARRYANENQVPVLLLTPPESGESLGEFAFSLGLSESEQLAFMLSEREPKDPTEELVRLQPVFSNEVCLSPLARQAALLSLVNGFEKDQDIQLAFFGSVSCARALLRTLKVRQSRASVILGLEASPLNTARKDVTRLSAGDWQSVARAPQFAYSELEVQPFRGASSWFGSLGIDAARLALAALKLLPNDGAVKQARVKARYRQAQRALATVSTDLLTSSMNGFDAKHRIPYRISISRIESKPLTTRD